MPRLAFEPNLKSGLNIYLFLWSHLGIPHPSYSLVLYA